jgi:hypothetical protein
MRVSWDRMALLRLAIWVMVVVGTLMLLRVSGQTGVSSMIGVGGWVLLALGLWMKGRAVR